VCLQDTYEGHSLKAGKGKKKQLLPLFETQARIELSRKIDLCEFKAIALKRKRRKIFSNFIQLVIMLCILEKCNKKLGSPRSFLLNIDGPNGNFATDEYLIKIKNEILRNSIREVKQTRPLYRSDNSTTNLRILCVSTYPALQKVFFPALKSNILKQNFKLFFQSKYIVVDLM